MAHHASSSSHSGAHKSQSVIGSIALALVIVGAINWGLVGLLNLNLVEALFGEGTTLTRAVYVLVGLSGLYSLTLFARVARTPVEHDQHYPAGYGPGHPDFVERRRMPQPVMAAR